MFVAKRLFVVLFVTALVAGTVVAQQPTASGPYQRLEVLRSQLEQVKRSVSSTVSTLKKSDDYDTQKDNPDSWYNRMKGLEKETSGLLNDVNSLRGKVTRSDQYEASDIDSVEERTAELKSRVDKALLESADARAAVSTNEGKPRKKKKKKKFLWIFGGGDKDDEYDELIGSVSPGRDRELFIVATREVRRRKYDVGRLLFQTIISTYPDSDYLPMAKLAVADSFYLQSNTSSLIQAGAAYRDWLTFFPTHPLADRVMLKIAEAEMRQIGLPDRDITNARRAEQRLRALLQQYPNSSLRPLAEARLSEVQDNLGMHNLIVGNFYYKRAVKYNKGGLKGAQSRYREIVEKYPKFKMLDEVLFKLAVTYQLEEETDQAARYYQQIVREWPNSEYVAKAKEQLELIGAEIPEPNPERKDVLPPEKESFFENFKNQFLGLYPMTIDKNGVLMTKKFDETKFELIDQVIENEGELKSSQIPKALTTVISDRSPEGGAQ
ncbi:MAG: outer membrane protein assembly factor BamD [Pyrinomonadaceae bacterium]|nr:outer membrane protein assembly factor BamD [Pyrinomonadaceae bacterium]